MPIEVVCLRPEADFARVGALPPPALSVRYCGPADAELAAHIKTAQALVIPAVGPKLPNDLFADTALKLVQVTGPAPIGSPPTRSSAATSRSPMCRAAATAPSPNMC